MEIINIETPKTARIEWVQNLDRKNNHLLICLHGYGQLVPFFKKNFEKSNRSMDFAIPEGLHRFYLQGSAGRVGASWMTKEERQSDIADNLVYLQNVLDHFSPHYQQISLLGFSQGGATAARFFATTPQLSNLVLWASVFPPDLEMEDIASDKRGKFFVLGEEDEYFDKKNQKDVIALYANLGFRTLLFNGEHKIHTDTLNQLLNEITKNDLA